MIAAALTMSAAIDTRNRTIMEESQALELL
jgi:hypothetical protein